MAERSNTSAAEQQNTSSKRPPWRKRLWRWMGFGETKLWDWLQLPSTLAMPIVVAVIPCSAGEGRGAGSRPGDGDLRSVRQRDPEGYPEGERLMEMDRKFISRKLDEHMDCTTTEHKEREG